MWHWFHSGPFSRYIPKSWLILCGSMTPYFIDTFFNTFRLRQNGCLFPNNIFKCIFLNESGWELGAFLRWWPPSAMWSGPFIFYGCHGGCLNDILSNLGLRAACWAYFMCHHELWPTSMSRPFSSLNSSFGLTEGENISRKLLSLSLDLFFKILLFQVAFLIFFSIAIFSPYFFLVGFLLYARL